MQVEDVEDMFEVTVVRTPGTAHRVVDVTEERFIPFAGWSEADDAYHIEGQNDETVTVRKALLPSNRYYFVYVPSLGEME